MHKVSVLESLKCTKETQIPNFNLHLIYVAQTWSHQSKYLMCRVMEAQIIKGWCKYNTNKLNIGKYIRSRIIIQDLIYYIIHACRWWVGLPVSTGSRKRIDISSTAACMVSEIHELSNFLFLIYFTYWNVSVIDLSQCVVAILQIYTLHLSF